MLWMGQMSSVNYHCCLFGSYDLLSSDTKPQQQINASWQLLFHRNTTEKFTFYVRM